MIRLRDSLLGGELGPAELSELEALRRWGVIVALWPIAAFLAGLIGSTIWYRFPIVGFVPAGFGFVGLVALRALARASLQRSTSIVLGCCACWQLAAVVAFCAQLTAWDGGYVFESIAPVVILGAMPIVHGAAWWAIGRSCVRVGLEVWGVMAQTLSWLILVVPCAILVNAFLLWITGTNESAPEAWLMVMGVGGLATFIVWIVGGVLFGIDLRRVSKLRSVIHHRRCLTCRYDLRGIDTNVCPECGNPQPISIEDHLGIAQVVEGRRDPSRRAASPTTSTTPTAKGISAKRSPR